MCICKPYPHILAASGEARHKLLLMWQKSGRFMVRVHDDSIYMRAPFAKKTISALLCIWLSKFKMLIGIRITIYKEI